MINKIWYLNTCETFITPENVSDAALTLVVTISAVPSTLILQMISIQHLARFLLFDPDSSESYYT